MTQLPDLGAALLDGAGLKLQRRGLGLQIGKSIYEWRKVDPGRPDDRPILSITGTFTARYGPDNRVLGSFVLTAPDSAELAPMLAADHHLGTAAAGLFGIPGAAGVLIAAPVGRWVDRRGPAPAVLAGSLLVLAGYIAFAFGPWTIAALVIGVMMLDFGIRTSLVANQTFLIGIEPEARARVNMLLMLHTFAGNGVGAFLASQAFAGWGWLGVVTVGVVSATAAALLHLRWRAGMVAPG